MKAMIRCFLGLSFFLFFQAQAVAYCEAEYQALGHRDYAIGFANDLKKTSTDKLKVIVGWGFEKFNTSGLAAVDRTLNQCMFNTYKSELARRTGTSGSTTSNNTKTASSNSNNPRTLQQQAMALCNQNASAHGLSGDARKSFMISCLRSNAATGGNTVAAGNSSNPTDLPSKKSSGPAEEEPVHGCLSIDANAVGNTSDVKIVKSSCSMKLNFSFCYVRVGGGGLPNKLVDCANNQIGMDSINPHGHGAITGPGTSDKDGVKTLFATFACKSPAYPYMVNADATGAIRGRCSRG